MSSGARLSNVCVSDLLVQIESSHLLYAADRQSHVCCSFAKRQVLFFQKRFLKFSDFSRNHNEIYSLGKYGLKFDIVLTDTGENIYKRQPHWQLKY